MLLTGLAGVIGGYALLGTVATAAPLLTLFFTGVATGASLSLFLQKKGKHQTDK